MGNNNEGGGDNVVPIFGRIKSPNSPDTKHLKLNDEGTHLPPAYTSLLRESTSKPFQIPDPDNQNTSGKNIVRIDGLDKQVFESKYDASKIKNPSDARAYLVDVLQMHMLGLSEGFEKLYPDAYNLLIKELKKITNCKCK